MYTLQNNTGDHVYYAVKQENGDWIINYHDRTGARLEWFNGRITQQYTVTAQQTASGVIYSMPRRAPAFLLYSPSLIGNTSAINVLDVYNCPVTAIESPATNFIAFPGTYTLGDAKSETRRQWAKIIETNQPAKIILHLPEVEFNPNSPDYSKELARLAEFTADCRNWFYTQAKRTIKPKNSKYTPAIFTIIGKEATDVTTLLEQDIKALFYVKDVEQYFTRFSNNLPTKEDWQFLGENYKIVDGEPEKQNTTPTEQIIKILLDVYRLRINLVTDESEVYSRSEDSYIPLDEKMLRAIKIRLNEEFGIKVSKDTLQEIVFSNWAELLHNKKYTRPTHHPFNDYFLSLKKHDGTDYIERIFNALTLDRILIPVRDFSAETLAQLEKALPDGSIKAELIDWRRAALHYFKKWIVGIVVQCLTKRDVNALMPILTGGTNKGKSTYIRYLLPPELTPYYIEGGVVPAITNYETAVNLRQSLLINFDDEPDGWPKHYWKSLKTMITTRSITYRAKYDKVPATHNRVCSFIASSNFPDILNDPTGTRRFIMLPVSDIERFFWEKIDIDSVWAQAVHLALTERLPINLQKHELELLLAANAVFFEESTEEQLLQEHLAPISEEQAAEEIRNPAIYSAYNIAANSSTVLMREIDIIAYLQNNAEPGTKLTTGGLRTALQKLGFKAPHVYKQRTYKDVRNQRCYAVNIVANTVSNTIKPEPAEVTHQTNIINTETPF